jgi:hypothetical protein
MHTHTALFFVSRAVYLETILAQFECLDFALAIHVDDQKSIVNLLTR